ncbi:hypothetical protein ACFC67_15820, partial [Enterococcus gallinarum]|uniref:hypothetical protein n=1 Tax=Enterococcus gallinarum TaxID=1353 RepID=UPI0035E0C829
MRSFRENKNQKDGDVFFSCLGFGTRVPFGQTKVAQANCKFPQTAHTFTKVKYSVLYFTWKIPRLTYQERWLIMSMMVATMKKMKN